MDYVDVPAVGIEGALREPCDLLKLDCEGAEFDIIAAADYAVLRRAQRIILEFHRTAGDPMLIVQKLSDSGFSASVLEEDSPAAGIIGAHRID
jgi:hypothetical protein